MKTVYCDESVWMPVARGLRSRGWKVKTAVGEDMLGEKDSRQLKFATDNGYLMLTFDDDFLGLVEKQGLGHKGIVYIDSAGKRVSDIIKKVDRRLQRIDKTGRTDKIHYL